MEALLCPPLYSMRQASDLIDTSEKVDSEVLLIVTNSEACYIYSLYYSVNDGSLYQHSRLTSPIEER